MLELRASGESVSGSGGSWCPLSGAKAVAGHRGFWRGDDHDLAAALAIRRT